MRCSEGPGVGNPLTSDEILEKLQKARRLVLETGTSCFLFWGDDWVPKLYERTSPARDLLGEVEVAVGEGVKS